MKRILALLALSSFGCVSCQPPPVATDGGTTVTPSSWTDTAATVLRVLSWSIPAAQVIVDGIVPATSRPVVDRSLVAVTDAATRLQGAVSAYNARGGDRCSAYAAVGGLTTALVALAQVLADNGIALGSTLVPVVLSLGAVADQLVPVCQSDAGFASAGASLSTRLHAIELDVGTRGGYLRPVLDNLHPATP